MLYVPLLKVSVNSLLKSGDVQSGTVADSGSSRSGWGSGVEVW